MKSVFDFRQHSTRDLEILEKAIGAALREESDDYAKQTLLGFRMIVQMSHNLAFERESEAHYKDIILEIDGNECTLAEFIQTNTKDPDVEHISDEDAAKVKALKVGGVFTLNLGAGGTTEIKRIR